MTRREFFKSPQMRVISRNIFSCAAIGYALAAATLFLDVIKSGDYASILNVVVLLACSLLIHLLQSRIAAIVLTAYAGFQILFFNIGNGKFTGWWLVLIGVYAIIFTFKFQKAWEAEKEFGGKEE